MFPFGISKISFLSGWDRCHHENPSYPTFIPIRHFNSQCLWDSLECHPLAITVVRERGEH